jgi:hypothetical protein
MTKKPRFEDKGVETVFKAYPQRMRRRLLGVREMIFDVARITPGVGDVQEALRWGQPSYLTTQSGSGSTIRIDQVRNAPGKFGIYFICTSGLIDTFKAHYKGEMQFEGNRSIVFAIEDRLPMAALRHCISLALTHHLRKRDRT